jgi:hypothetical protein
VGHENLGARRVRTAPTGADSSSRVL